MSGALVSLIAKWMLFIVKDDECFSIFLYVSVIQKFSAVTESLFSGIENVY